MTREQAHARIQDANSCGQGTDPGHARHLYHATITRWGYTYSHSTPVRLLDGSFDVRHTYKQGPHNVSTRERSRVWDTSTSSASGRQWSGVGVAELGAHLKSKARRYGLGRG